MTNTFISERGWTLVQEQQLMLYIQPPNRPSSRLSLPDFADQFFSLGNIPGESKDISVIRQVGRVRPEMVKVTKHRLTRNSASRISISKFRQLHAAWRLKRPARYYMTNRFLLGLIKQSDEKFYAVPIPFALRPRGARKLAKNLNDVAKILSNPSPMEALEVLFQKHYFDGLNMENFVNHTAVDSIEDLHDLLESPTLLKLIASQTK
jgi:hypothetical protein